MRTILAAAAAAALSTCALLGASLVGPSTASAHRPYCGGDTICADSQLTAPFAQARCRERAGNAYGGCQLWNEHRGTVLPQTRLWGRHAYRGTFTFRYRGFKGLNPFHLYHCSGWANFSAHTGAVQKSGVSCK